MSDAAASSELGLIWVTHESVGDHQLYQVLEAQPDVLAALKSVRFAKVVRRSIHLTPFGEDFCRICLALDDDELAELPEHSEPGDQSGTPPTPSA